jgi:two-component system chemotaxis response regulator CheB
VPKLLIADDSALMRKYLGEIFKAEGDFDLAFARNGEEALALAHTFAPDVISLDINMPVMDGITCLSRIMVECPKPVVMVSSLTDDGAEVTLQALSLGAVDYIAKPDGTVSLHINKIKAELVKKIRAAAKARIRKSRGLLDRVRRNSLRSVRSPKPRESTEFSNSPVPGLILIGVSTGGPGAIEYILPRLPRDFPWPILIAQHMPASFTGVLARRINDLSEIEVLEARSPVNLRRGVAYIGRGDADMLVISRGGCLSATPIPSSAVHKWHPSVDRLVTSALTHVEPTRLVGVMLTGMGDDGALAMAELHSKGGRTIAESEETAVIWGMPGELVKHGGATLVLPIDSIADQLVQWTA